MFSDQLVLLKVDSATGASEILDRFGTSPLVGRTTEHYRSRIFNFLSARISPTDAGVDFAVAMNVPRVPQSEGMPRWSNSRA